jgi:hypothetical protein
MGRGLSKETKMVPDEGVQQVEPHPNGSTQPTPSGASRNANTTMAHARGCPRLQIPRHCEPLQRHSNIHRASVQADNHIDVRAHARSRTRKHGSLEHEHTHTHTHTSRMIFSAIVIFCRK